MFVCGSLAVSAQTSSNSPYTRYGLGDLSDQIFTNNAAMGGIGYGLRSNKHINAMNPASYTSVDSLSFMFDAGFSLRSSNYQENGFKSNAKNSSFDYLTMQFRLHPRLGLAAGLTPFSDVGYNFTVVDPVEGNEDVNVMNQFKGEGGLQTAFIGLGFKVLDNLSVGANFGYLYGKQLYRTVATLSNGGDSSIKFDRRRINSFMLDLGAQYTQVLNENNNFTVGLTYSLGHDVNVKETKGIQITDGEKYNQIKEEDFHDGYSLPHSFGAGITYNYKKSLTLGLDYSLQKWSKTEFDHKEGMYNDRNRVAFGAEYVPDAQGRNYFKRMSYRAGTYYTSSYLKTQVGDGPKEIGVTAGFAFPLNLYQRKTVLSITGQYAKLKPSVNSLMKEDRFVLKLGLTFNEPRFMKWRGN